MQNQFEEFMNHILLGLGTINPLMEIACPDIATKPYVSLSCDVEQAEGDEHTIVNNLRLNLYVSFDDDSNDGVLVDLTLQESLQSTRVLFRDVMVPLNLIMAQPDKEFIGALVAHAAAKKANYTIKVEEITDNNEVRFLLEFGGHTFQAVVDRDIVAKYFGWSLLSIQ